MLPNQTMAPGHHVVLYDGLCKFCQAGMKQLVALARPGAIHPVNFQEAGSLDPFPGITLEDCMREMHLVTPTGKIYRGFEAAVQAMVTRPRCGWLAYGYYIPGIRFLLDRLYAMIAARRYRVMGKALAAGECAEGTCALHAYRPSEQEK